jgi:hypothetical protein
MSRNRLLWLTLAVAVMVIVTYQVVASSGGSSRFIAQADIPTVAPGVDVLAGWRRCRCESAATTT